VLLSLGLKVPDDVSLIGFDNIDYDSEIIPRLTTFDIDKKEFGRTAVDMLYEKLQNPNLPNKLIEIFARLIERESVKTV
jgi:DNA-binding LacI/PurR family transcriptional regulator